MNKSEILKGIKKEGCNFIANNYWKLSKEELKEICIAYMYALKESDKKNIVNYENIMALDDLKMYL